MYGLFNTVYHMDSIFKATATSLYSSHNLLHDLKFPKDSLNFLGRLYLLGTNMSAFSVSSDPLSRPRPLLNFPIINKGFSYFNLCVHAFLEGYSYGTAANASRGEYLKKLKDILENNNQPLSDLFTDLGGFEASLDDGFTSLVKSFPLISMTSFRVINPLLSYGYGDCINQCILNYLVNFNINNKKTSTFKLALDKTVEDVGITPAFLPITENYKYLFEKCIPVNDVDLSIYDIVNLLHRYKEMLTNKTIITTAQNYRLLGGSDDITALGGFIGLNPQSILGFSNIIRFIKGSFILLNDCVFSNGITKGLEAVVKFMERDPDEFYFRNKLREFMKIKDLIKDLESNRHYRHDIANLVDKSKIELEYKNKYINKVISDYSSTNSENIIAFLIKHRSYGNSFQEDIENANKHVIKEFELSCIRRHQQLYDEIFQEVISSIVNVVDEDEITGVFVPEERKPHYKLVTSTGADVVLEEYNPITLIESNLLAGGFVRMTVKYMHKISKRNLTGKKFAYDERFIGGLFDFLNISQLTDRLLFVAQNINTAAVKGYGSSLGYSPMRLYAGRYYNKLDSFMPNKLYKLLAYGASYDYAYSLLTYSIYASNYPHITTSPNGDLFDRLMSPATLPGFLGAFFHRANLASLQGINTFSYSEKPLFVILQRMISQTVLGDQFELPNSYLKTILTAIPESTVELKIGSKISFNWEIRKLLGVDCEEEENSFLSLLRYPKLATKESFALFRDFNGPMGFLPFSFDLGLEYVFSGGFESKYNFGYGALPGSGMRSLNMSSLFINLPLSSGLMNAASLSFLDYVEKLRYKPTMLFGSDNSIAYIPQNALLILFSALGMDAHLSFNYGSSLFLRILDCDVNLKIFNSPKSENIYIFNVKEMLRQAALLINYFLLEKDSNDQDMFTRIADSGSESIDKMIDVMFPSNSAYGFMYDFISESPILGVFPSSMIYGTKLIDGYSYSDFSRIAGVFLSTVYKNISYKKYDIAENRWRKTPIGRIKPSIFFMEEQLDPKIIDGEIYTKTSKNISICLKFKNSWLVLPLSSSALGNLLASTPFLKKEPINNFIDFAKELGKGVAIGFISPIYEIISGPAFSTPHQVNNHRKILRYFYNTEGDKYTERELIIPIRSSQSSTGFSYFHSGVLSTAFLLAKGHHYAPITLRDSKISPLIGRHSLVSHYRFTDGIIVIAYRMLMIEEIKDYSKKTYMFTKRALNIKSHFKMIKSLFSKIPKPALTSANKKRQILK